MEERWLGRLEEGSTISDLSLGVWEVHKTDRKSVVCLSVQNLLDVLQVRCYVAWVTASLQWYAGWATSPCCLGFQDIAKGVLLRWCNWELRCFGDSQPSECVSRERVSDRSWANCCFSSVGGWVQVLCGCFVLGLKLGNNRRSLDGRVDLCTFLNRIAHLPDLRTCLNPELSHSYQLCA